jgi:DNA sulfur modification protein DndD
MIFDCLTLHNFGVYRGEHRIDLTTTSKRPVVLFGALNGGGKTTLLDAFQLVLFGKLCKTSNRGRLGYQDYLLRCINRAVDPRVGAGLVLNFRYRRAGQEDAYRVTRNWRVTGQALKETVEVERNGVVDASITERWQEFVEELIPSQISDLFFFDGEKIESLADPERSAELLKVGIHSLLGLDLVDDLSRSLVVIERRRRSEAHSEGPSEELSCAESNLASLQERSQQLTDELAHRRTQLDGYHRKVADLERAFQSAGGDLYQRRAEIERKLADAQRRLREVADRLREHAAGDAPLFLLVSALEKAEERARSEAEARDAQVLLKILEKRDGKLSALLLKEGVRSDALSKIDQFLEASTKEFRAKADLPLQLNVEPHVLSTFSATRFHAISSTSRQHVAEHEQVLEEVRSAEASLQAVPQEQAVAGILEQLMAKRQEIAKTEARIAVGAEELEKTYRGVEGAKETLNRLHQEFVSIKLANEASERVIRHSQKARETLVKFRSEVARRNLRRLEGLITESFGSLLRKKTLVKSIRIDSESYALHIHDGHGDEIAASRLSAGERQILAVAILWSLARASGRVLPTVIDTPLGRLDSSHRNFLVKNYFPTASHQVILLSTDEEIYGRYYQTLAPFVAREYQIVHREDDRTSAVKSGYFAREDAA